MLKPPKPNPDSKESLRKRGCVCVLGCACTWMCVHLDVRVLGYACTWMCVYLDVRAHSSVTRHVTLVAVDWDQAPGKFPF